jgi:hypothetical protein
MKHKKNKVTIIQTPDERLCPNCSTPFQRRKHTEITPKLLSKIYYFSEWDVCPNCSFVQHYEKYKVFNKKEDKILIDEYNEMNDLFKSL